MKTVTTTVVVVFLICTACTNSNYPTTSSYRGDYPSGQGYYDTEYNAPSGNYDFSNYEYLILD